ncbi:amino acid racemase [Yoonia sp. BS5-3]|uniref:Aspartate/glutamate racemase family protein n=1 Tax=Yoonia phaeophyticola TaxID=3137369 RepID=A0ABZ2VBC7_9RHOB
MTRCAIGILGGMGPQATILLQERLLRAIPATDDADHIPLLIDMNPQVPSRIKWLIEGRGADPAPALVAMGRRLETAGAAALAMPCNTAHAFADDIDAATGIPFLNMPQLAAGFVASKVPEGSAIGILASPATQKTELFKSVLAPHGLTALYPEDDAPLLAAIKQIKASGPSSYHQTLLNQAADTLVQRGAVAILVGCSEFSLLSDQITASVPVIDTMNVLTQQLVDFANIYSGNPPEQVPSSSSASF